MSAFLSLIKPRIIMGNAITAAGGFALASRGLFDFGLFVAMLAGLSLIIASACVFNNYIDSDADIMMARTQHRPLATGAVSTQVAILYAVLLLALGILALALFTNLLTTCIALFGFLSYVLLYSLSKYHTVHATLIGSIAGAIPPVAGYCAVSERLDLGALLLFMMIALWQMPHFYAIAIYKRKEYAAASIPVLPVAKGIPATKVQMVLYTAAFAVSSVMLTVCGYTGYAYLIVASILGSYWLWQAIRGLTCTDDVLWARKMFRSSLIIVTALCISIPFSVI
ncbi:MAG: protoheme IX farnesyltransferase [Candidatus Melainabacteria bacterium]|nr:protoheme IX farnesyltransferase [Candidatus Melainabacteria bacterium]